MHWPGCVIRSHSGGFIVARSIFVVGLPNPKLAEALSLCEPFSWLKEQGLSNIVVECDALSMIQSLQFS